MHSPTPTTRRSFLRRTAAALAFPTIIPGGALGKGDRPAPSERITLGVIGVGARGLAVIKDFLTEPDAQVVAVCDVHDFHYRDRKWGAGNPMGWQAAKAVVDKHYETEDCAATTQAEEVISRSDVDAILVMTPDHWHALHTLQALQAGKDVYCEKPVTHYFAEGVRVVNEVAKRKAVFQVGSQQRSEEVFRQAVALVRNGLPGKVHTVEVGLPPGPEEPRGDTTVSDPPKGLDYEAWCGPSPVLPFMPARHHRNWRYALAYGGGNPMDWIGHHNDIAHWGMGFEHSGPIQVQATGWTYPEQRDIYDTPIDYTIACMYPGEVTWTIASHNRKGTKWIGENGWVFVDRGLIEASNPAWLDPAFDPGPWKAYFSPGHQRNFLDCVKSRKECVAPAENGHRSITPGHLGYVSQALGRELRWDAKNQEVLGDPEAQTRLMEVPYREGWKLPA